MVSRENFVSPGHMPLRFSMGLFLLLQTPYLDTTNLTIMGQTGYGQIGCMKKGGR